MNFLTAHDCANLFRVTKKTWYEWVRCDTVAPKPVLTASHYTRWNEDDVLAYQKILIAEQRTGYMKKTAAA
jgi:predicted DNA-binding transcriptional regulator AlpA